MVRQFLWGAWLFLMLSAVAADILPDLAAGREKSSVCVVCHGGDGNSVVAAWPKIAGQSERYLIEQLKEFRKGQQGNRFNAVMYGIVQALTDQDIADLAAFYAVQKPTPGVVQEQWVSLGEKIYRGGNSASGVPACAGCHDPKGAGNALAGFPPLSAQQSDYVIEQLKAFKSGARLNDPNQIMQDITKRMTESEMEAVGHYVSGLQ
jgi:cytochrome c553